MALAIVDGHAGIEHQDLAILGLVAAARVPAVVAAKESGADIFSANSKLGLMPTEKLEKVLAPENLLKLGYQVGELE